VIGAAVLLAGICSKTAQCQTYRMATITDNLENIASYAADFYASSKYGKRLAVTPSAGPGSLRVTTEIGDICDPQWGAGQRHLPRE
jgi:hypothetical protein